MNNERKWILRGGRVLNPAPFCLIGIVNVTPDSFSDGGKYIDPRNAVAHGLRLLDEGAGMLDLGAESTRPFAEPVPEGEEIARLMPVVARLREQRPDAVLSVDTLKAGTARAALEGRRGHHQRRVGLRGRSGVARRACRIQAGVCAHAQSGQPARNAGEPPLRERGGGDSGLF